jgi:hypothetical protein
VFVTAVTRLGIGLLLVPLLVTPVASADSPLRVIVTGDSMMEPLDRLLEPPVEEVGGRLISDPRPGTGILSPFTFDWQKHARRQVKRYRPQLTVMFIGPNDSNRVRTDDGREVACCRRAWIDEYAQRVERMMRTYRRESRGWIYWLTLPTPVEPHDAPFAAINLAIAEAADAVGSHARAVDTVPVISPGNKFRRRIRYRGRMVRVRDRDGVHLTTAGSRIVMRLVRQTMRADGLL